MREKAFRIRPIAASSLGDKRPWRNRLENGEFKEILHDLETKCLVRDRRGLAAGIHWIFKGTPPSPTHHMRLIEWAWRASLHHLALHLAFTDPVTHQKAESEPQVLKLPADQIHWGARMLVSTGSWPYALHLLNRVPPRSARSRISAAMALKIMGRSQDALELITKVAKAPDSELRWQVISCMSQCLMDLNRGHEALVWIRRGLALTTTDPDRWALECMHARAIGQAESVQQGLKAFKGVIDRLVNASALAPRWYGYVQVWYASLLAAYGRTEDAKLRFARAIDHNQYAMEDYQPWRTLYVMAAMKRADLLSDEQLAEYDRYPVKDFWSSPNLVREWSPKRPTWEIDIYANEVFKGDTYQGPITLELRLAAGLILAGSIGMNVGLAKYWVWPDALPLHLGLDERLSQLVNRLRKTHHLKVHWERGTLRANSGAANQYRVNPAPDALPRFISQCLRTGKPSFSQSQLSLAYGVPPRKSTALLVEWAARGWVEKSGAGRSTRYQITTKLQASGCAVPHP